MLLHWWSKQTGLTTTFQTMKPKQIAVLLACSEKTLACQAKPFNNDSERITTPHILALAC